MDVCNKCLKQGNIKKICIHANRQSNIFNFSSEIHLCEKCYIEFSEMFDIEDFSNNKSFPFERELMIYLKSFPVEGQEKILNHYAYGPFIEYKRPDEWIKENSVNENRTFYSNEVRRKRTAPKGKREKETSKNCSELYWLERNGTNVLYCSIEGDYDEKKCLKCPYNKNRKTKKEDAVVEPNSPRSESEERQASTENVDVKKKSQKNKRRKIGELEFGFPER